MLVCRNTGLRPVGAKYSVPATILVFALLASVVPFNLFGSTELCNMSCCAMRGPHSVASHCSDSVCHLNTSEAHHPQSPVSITGAVMASGCPRSCGAVTGYSVNQHRRSEPAVSAALTSPKKSQGRTLFSTALLSSLLQQQFPPRAPPFNLS
jgi:hypothetical protein